MAAVMSTGSTGPFESLTQLPLPNHIVAQFPIGTWVENIAVRSNGNLLVTTLAPDASLYEVFNPACGGTSHAFVRHFTLAEVSGLLGIAETSSEVFAFVGGDFTGAPNGNYALWTVDFNGLDAGASPQPTLRASLPEALLLNGATALPQNRHVVLVADSALGLAWRVDTLTGDYGVGVQVPEMQGVGPDGGFAIGINGLHMEGGHLWWTNDVQSTLYRIGVTADGRAVDGAGAENVTRVAAAPRLDDFIFGSGGAAGGEGVVWVAGGSSNSVFAAKPASGMQPVNVVGTGGGATACAFGRSDKDGKVLYITTSGGRVNGTSEGGKVVAVDTGGFHF